MKKLAILFAGLFIMAISVQNVNAQEPVESAQAEASATIVTPIAISKVLDLKFGNIVASAAGGTVEITELSDVPNYDGVSASSITGDPARAEFKVTGLDGAAFTITLPANNEIELTGDGTAMALTSFVHDAEATITNGDMNFKVGATLNVNANQTAGAYTANFDVKVNYN